MIVRSLTAVALAAFVGGAIALGGAVPAQAAGIPLDFHFGSLLPGTTAHATQSIEVPQDGIVSSAKWTSVAEPAGTVWTIEVCPQTGACIGADDLVDARLAQGTYSVHVAVTLPADVAQGAVAQRDGVLQLTADDSALAVTGGTVPWTLAVAGAVVTGLGAALLIGRRRKERDA